MTNTQLFLSIGIPTLAVILSYLDVRGHLSQIEADLRRFYHELGRHEGQIEILKDRK